MGVEAGHVEIQEFSREVIPQINWMVEDLFCRYDVAMPYFLLDFDFPDYSERPDWVSGYSFNLDWGPWGYWLPWFNELMGLLFDEADLPRWQMPDFSLGSLDMFNSKISELYENVTTEEEIVMDNLATDNHIRRTSDYMSTYAAAKSDYEDNPNWLVDEDSCVDMYPMWTVYYSGGKYLVRGDQVYASFDTSAVTTVASAKFQIEIAHANLHEVTESQVLCIYKHDWGDSLTSADWTGGSLIATREISQSDMGTVIEMEISTTDVTTEDYSKYRFTLQKLVDSDYWPEPTHALEGHSLCLDPIELVLT